MTAARADAQRGTPAALAILRVDVFDRLTSSRGADTEVAKAELIGVDRATLSRMRRRLFAPRLHVAMRMADLLDTTIDELFERVDTDG